MNNIVLEQTDRTRVHRLPERGHYDRATIHAILDEALICHVGFVVEGRPVVIPTIHARVGDHLYFHGSPAAGMLRTLRGGVDACVTVTLLDGLVLARSAFHSSMNYRSVVVFGKAEEVSDREEKLRVLEALVVCVRPEVLLRAFGRRARTERDGAEADLGVARPDRRGIGEDPHRSAER